MDYIIVISTDPEKNSDYEQGLEIAMTLSEIGINCCVCLEGDFLRKLEDSFEDIIYLKKLKQLELFDIPLISPRSIPYSYCTVKKEEEIRELYGIVLTVICF